MEPEFWKERWREGQIGFHREGVNPFLLAHADVWLGSDPPGSVRVLVPLCGKTHDLDWLARRGHRVVGVELSELAAEQFFAEHGRSPTRVPRGPYEAWVDGDLELWVGDVFDLGDERFDRVWDRAALVALPPPLRDRYAPLLHAVGAGGELLLVVLDGQPGGPPHAIPPAEVARRFPGARLVAEEPASDPRWGDAPVMQRAYLARL